MTQIELHELLQGIGLPLTYRKFTNPPNLPYIVYLFESSDNFGADNIVFHTSNNFQVELYSDIKDLANEDKIEKLLTDNEIYWEKSETYIDSEEMYQVIYEISI